MSFISMLLKKQVDTGEFKFNPLSHDKREWQGELSVTQKNLPPILVKYVDSTSHRKSRGLATSPYQNFLMLGENIWGKIC